MNEREKILESIKKGILSPEEGLDLLESLGLKDTETQTKETAEDVVAPVAESNEPIELEKAVESEEIPETGASTASEESFATEEEPQSEEFTYEETTASSEVPEFNETSEQEPEMEAETVEEALQENNQPSDSVASMIDEWENKAEPETKETDPVRSKIDEFDLALQTKIEALREKKEEFRELNLEAELGIISAENEVIYKQMKIELKELEEEIELLKHERKAIDEDLFSSPERPYVSDGFFEVPDDFEEQKYRPMDRPQVEPNDWASRIGRVVNKAAGRVSDKVNNDFDWKNINQKFYGTAKTHFSHQFTFEDIDAKTIDIKLAKGKIILKTWEDETINDVKVEASAALLGQMDEPDPLDAFLERSRIDVNNYQILFHVPNKRVDAKLTFYLPKRQYNNLSLRLLNGDLMIDELAAKNTAIQATNGTILIKELDASMLEFEGTNNQVEIREGQILDASIETVTGTIISRADVVRSEYSLINGDIKLTAKNDDLKKIEAQSVNGDVKVSLPQTVGIEGSAKTGIGTINYRFANCETVQERSGDTQKVLHFQRAAGEAAQIEVSSKAGNIFLKDYDK
ncbi:daptomycin-sensing surface protein LiaX [Candidatus Enterococcus murrayae]|uniref:Daptomycin-sensing surface protein LiaX n=1 Tax=Candidatus Enterococcus murrayae TaxID=2815321 RepID=A0ABS3HL86_9ENTE|nr:daptomycin-sensing surface protein LiaX [Enterococcus sp. MJM16]MBO0454207.1 daptomycin-sensing surface protein LiaX [Enterococcus sp. MJM16]